MIARLWHGYTTRENADAYQQLLREEILPGIHRIKGFKGAHLMRRERGDEVEFITLMVLDSMDSVRAFAGDDFEKAVVPDHARKLLKRFDERSAHYETEWIG